MRHYHGPSANETIQPTTLDVCPVGLGCVFIEAKIESVVPHLILVISSSRMHILLALRRKRKKPNQTLRSWFCPETWASDNAVLLLLPPKFCCCVRKRPNPWKTCVRDGLHPSRHCYFRKHPGGGSSLPDQLYLVCSLPSTRIASQTYFVFWHAPWNPQM